KIRNKISLTFILLLIFGVTAVSSYAIMFIRNYLLEEGRQTVIRHAEWMSLTVAEAWEDDVDLDKLRLIQEASGYDITIFGEDGDLLFGSDTRGPGPELSSDIVSQVVSNGYLLIDAREN